jgi:signal peptidase I
MKNEKNDWTFKEFVSFIILIFVVVLPIRFFVAQPFIVSGESMEPTFETGQYLIVDQLSYRFNEPQRGDVVIFRLPAEPSRFLIKRLIGLPGETVKIEGENVYIKESGEEEAEFVEINNDFIEFPKEANINEDLSEDEYFVLGDNRVVSLDSRYFGAIKEEFIVGRALIRLFPFSKIDWMPGKQEI